MWVFAIILQPFHGMQCLIFMHRLRHNVIKTGIRMISLSYSRISLSDIAKKLLLDGAEDAEFIVSKVRFLLLGSHQDLFQDCAISATVS